MLDRKINTSKLKRGGTRQGHIIHEILNDPSLWSGDMTYYEGENNQIYFIDDLIGKEVEVENMGIFTVPESR